MIPRSTLPLRCGALLLLTILLACAEPAEFLAGADCSHLKFFEDRGVVYRTNGVAGDALVILKNAGINCVRLRLFTSSAAQAQNDPYNYINNLDYTVPLAVRVKNAGMKLLLDFHYSDTWADPAHQSKPSAWSGLSFAQLKQQMRDYNSNCIAAFAAAGATPDYVQIGNEITGGLLWTDGQIGGAYENATQWSQLGQLMKSAIQGIKDAAGTNTPKIMIHIDRGGDWETTKWYFDKVTAQNVPFDIIGESFYPWWHGDLNALNECLTNAAARYNKPVVVAETAFPFSNSTNIHGFAASTNGQVQFMIELAKVVKGVPGNRGMGIFWWAAEFQRVNGYSLAGFDRRSFFNTSGNVLPVAGTLGQLSSPTTMNASLDGDELNLEWPLSGAGMKLMAANVIDWLWSPVTNDVTNTGSGFSLKLPLEEGPGNLYRLQVN